MMNEVTLEFRCADNIKPSIMVDKKVVKTKKGKFGARTCLVQTEKPEIELEIYKHLELAGRLWFLMNILFFIVSLFGILDAHYDRRCIVIDCKYKIKVKDKAKVIIYFNSLKEQRKATEIQSNTQVEEISNMYYVDEKIKKRFKIALITRILLIVAILITCLVVFIN